MGKSYSHFNIWAVSTIIYTNKEDIERLIKYIEKHNDCFISNRNNNHNDNITSKEKVLEQVNYTIHKDKFIECLHTLNFHKSDIDLIINLFILTDKRGFSECDIREVLISLLLLCTKNIPLCIELSMDMINRDKTLYLDKFELLRIFTIFNDTCYYFGDKYLTTDQIKDLIDSLYTSIGNLM